MDIYSIRHSLRNRPALDLGSDRPLSGAAVMINYQSLVNTRFLALLKKRFTRALVTIIKGSHLGQVEMLLRMSILKILENLIRVFQGLVRTTKSHSQSRRTKT